MGSGKSTLGSALSQRTGLQFIDLDTYIERRFHANVRDIFASRGEDGFRDLERRMLREVGEFEDVIVACGGGTPCFFDNIEWMNSVGTTVFLEASHQRLFDRLKAGRHKRPLISRLSDSELEQYIASMVEKRLPFYTRAPHRFCADWLDSRQTIDQSVDQFISQFNIPTIKS